MNDKERIPEFLPVSISLWLIENAHTIKIDFLKLLVGKKKSVFVFKIQLRNLNIGKSADTVSIKFQVTGDVLRKLPLLVVVLSL